MIDEAEAAKIRMWAYDKLDYMFTIDNGDWRHVGMLETVKYADLLAAWVMSAKLPEQPINQSARKASEVILNPIYAPPRDRNAGQ